MERFEAAELAKKFDVYLNNFRSVVKDNQKTLGEITVGLDEKIREFYQRGFLNVAFVGEYSAGKSTIISALTNRRDIKISADIATAETTSYDWFGIKLTDTPGLWTERNDHSEITYNAISISDLLVFCLTHSLFDSATIENFKVLAYEKKYRHKMMLVVNKMSEEAGEENIKINSYKKSITKALEPFRMDEFPISFIDALDYITGVDEKNDELVIESRFGEFKDQLNLFVKKKGALAKLDVPIRLLNEAIFKGISLLARNNGEDNAYLELLNRLSRQINNERFRLRTRAKTISMELASQVAELGSNLALQVGEAKDFEVQLKKQEIEVQKLSEQAVSQLEEATNSAVSSMQDAVKEVLNSDLSESFVSQLESPGRIEARAAKTKESLGRLKAQVSSIKSIASEVGLTIAESAVAPGVEAGGPLLKAGASAGSKLHKGIYSVGKFVGFKFKPWQAVNIAKNIGNVMKFVGPVLIAVSVVIDIVDSKREADNEKKLGEARREVNSQFLKIARDLEDQFDNQLRRAELEIYGPLEEKIKKARDQEEEAMTESSRDIERLSKIRKNLESLLDAVAI